MPTPLNSTSVGLERVAEVVKNYYSFDDSLARIFEPSTSIHIGRQLYRQPFKKYPAGSAAKVSGNSGVLPTGTGPVYDDFKAAYFYSAIGYGLTQEQIDITSSPSVARVNVFTDMVNDITKVLSQHDNVYLFGDGRGILTGESSAVPSSTTITFNGSSDGLKTNRLFMGMSVDVWDSTGATKRSGGPFTITGIDSTTNIVTLSAAPSGMTAGDVLTVVGLDVYGPSTLTTGSSTWPGGGLTSADGLTGDSWMHGLEYANNITTSYYLGKLKSDYPQLVPQYENVTGAASLTYDMIESAKNKLIQTRPDEVSKLMFVMHQDRQFDLKKIGMTIVRDLAAPSPKLKDLMASDGYGEMFNMAGFPCFLSRCADRTRVDGFIKGNWVRVEGRKTDFFKNPDTGGYIFPKRSSDKIVTAWELWTLQAKDWACIDPGASVFVYGLPAA